MLNFRTRLRNLKSTGEKIGNSAARDLISLYRAIGIMTKPFLDNCCDLVIPGTKVIIISITVFCTYSCIRMDGPLAALLGFLGVWIFGCLVVILGSIAGIYEDSLIILDLMTLPNFTGTHPRNVHGRNHLALTQLGMLQNDVELGVLEIYDESGNSIKKDVKSLRPIEIRMRGTYFIDRENTVTVVQFIVDQTVNFLIANP